MGEFLASNIRDESKALICIVRRKELIPYSIMSHNRLLTQVLFAITVEGGPRK